MLGTTAFLPPQAEAIAPERAAPRRAGSRERTRLALFETAWRAFAQRGLDGVNLKTHILEPAGVSVGSFYHQYRDKTDLLVAILDQHSASFRRMVEAARAADTDTPSEVTARHSFEVVLRVAEENEDLFHLLQRERQSTEPRVRAFLAQNHRLWVEALADGYRSRLPASLFQMLHDDTLVLAAELALATTVGGVMRYLDLDPTERKARRPEFLDALVLFSLGGIKALLESPGARPGGSKVSRP